MSAIGVAIAAGSLLAHGTARAGQADIDRFTREYPRAAKRLMEQFSGANGSGKIRTIKDGKQQGGVDRVSFASDHGYHKVELVGAVRVGDSERELIFCFGERTGFSLRRDSNDPDYEVLEIGSDKVQDDYRARFGKFLTAAYSILGYPLIETMGHRNFRLLSAGEVESDGRKLLEVHYEIGESSETSDNAWVTLDPDSGWVVRSSSIQPRVAHGAMIRCDVDYGPLHDGIPVPRVVKNVSLSGELTVCEFDHFAFEPTPEHEFTMASYGLPDLTAPAPRRSARPYWFAGIAVVGLVLAVAFRAVAERLRPKHS